MVTVVDIQKDLPNSPKEVIEPWLIELANDPNNMDGPRRNHMVITVGKVARSTSHFIVEERHLETGNRAGTLRFRAAQNSVVSVA
jgi:hypothetical protein